MGGGAKISGGRKRQIGGRRIGRGGALESQIAASEVLRRDEEQPVFIRNRRLAFGLHGSEQVNGSAGVFQLQSEGMAEENQFGPNADEKDWTKECGHSRERHVASGPRVS